MFVKKEIKFIVFVCLLVLFSFIILAQGVDSDLDGWLDIVDNCPNIANNQTDGDGDGRGDVCDNCIAVANFDQNNSDFDSFGDVCDSCLGDTNNDQDLDTVCALSGFKVPMTGDQDNCPLSSNLDQLDADLDSIGDVCDPDDDNDGRLDIVDNCILIPNVNQENLDGDAFGDACDFDIDGDFKNNSIDNCVNVSNIGQSDLDSDGIGDVCDSESDIASCNDGIDNDGDNLCDDSGCDSMTADPDCSSIACPACSSCGNGVLNFCDSLECSSCGSCFFDDGFVVNGCGECSSLLSCSDYSSQALCQNNDCNKPGCTWKTSTCCTDLDGDGFASELTGCGAVDWDDSDNSTYPSAIDICDGKDNDANGLTDEEFVPELCDFGLCRTTSTPSSCVGGTVITCIPGLPDLVSDEADCKYIDYNCNAQIDGDCVAPAVEFKSEQFSPGKKSLKFISRDGYVELKFTG